MKHFLSSIQDDLQEGFIGCLIPAILMILIVFAVSGFINWLIN